VLAASVISLVLLLGVAHFAYTPLLPIMQEQTILDDISAGCVAAINYAGYMCAAFIAASVIDLMIKDTLYRAGLITAIVTRAGMVVPFQIGRTQSKNTSCIPFGRVLNRLIQRCSNLKEHHYYFI
jgi:fucose permease